MCMHLNFVVAIVQLLSHVRLFVTWWTAAPQAFLSITISWNLLKFMSIESVMPSNQLILCHPLLPLSSILPSIRVFSSELAHCIRWPKYWSFSISPTSKYSGLISFRINWFDLLAVQGTFKNLLQHCSAEIESINSSVLSLLYGPALRGLRHPAQTLFTVVIMSLSFPTSRQSWNLVFSPQTLNFPMKVSLVLSKYPFHRQNDQLTLGQQITLRTPSE